MILAKERVILGGHAASREDAIRKAGTMLVEAGLAQTGYVEEMLAREEIMSTSLGVGVAIPHGTYDARKLVLKSGIAVLGLADGVEWQAGDRVRLVIAIAAAADELVGVMANLAEAVTQPDALQELLTTDDPQVILRRLEDHHTF
jgi:phosphocarrier protein FPr